METSATRVALLARRRRVEALFELAADLPAAAQGELLAAECAGDGGLRREVETLLRHDLAARAELEGLVGDAAAAAGGLADWHGGHAGVAGEEGLELGNWRLTRLLGSGGMGTVWLGERIAGDFDQQVAIKLIRPGLETAHVVQRFAAERRILAGLAHPAIARLYDGGAGPGGRPYLVMEYVEGQPCTAAAVCCWPLARKLQLFLAVADAVAYAHRNLVVHRDLKPGNILVTPDGAPKLLDFGIAKLLDPDKEKTQTAAGILAFSPEYASPEQVKGETITTATDVYSLGLVLFELLTGERAQPVPTLNPVALFRAVCQTEKPRPSVAAPQLRRELAGDLDAIVAKALRQEPEARYASAAELADDLRRYLVANPVQARQGTFLYRAGLVVRRHRAAFLAALLVLLSLFGGLVATAWQARERAKEARRAERRFDQVRGLATRFLFDFDKALGRQPVTEVRKMVVTTAVEHLGLLAADAGGDRGLQLELAQAYVRLARVQGSMDSANLGERREALASLDRGLELAGRAAAGGLPDYLEAMALVHLEKAILFGSLGKDGEMLAEIGRGLEFSRRVPVGAASDSGKRIHSSLLLRLADYRTGRGEPARARTALAEALLLESKNVGTTLARLGVAAREEGDLAASLGYFEKARAAAAIRSDQCQIAADRGRTLYDPDRPSLGREAEAIAAADEAIACAEELIAADPRDVRSVFTLLNALGAGGGIYARAAPERALASLDRAGQALDTLESLAPEAAELELEKALLEVARALPLAQLGRAAEAERRLAAAAPILAAHQADREDLRAADAAWLAAFRRGELYEALGRPAPAAAEYRRASALAQEGLAARPERPLERHFLAIAETRLARIAGGAGPR